MAALGSAAASDGSGHDQEGPSSRELFGLSPDTQSGTAWQGSEYKSATRTFTKWWPTTYPGEWKLPNGMRYPFVWRLVTVGTKESQGLPSMGAQCYESWTWDWIETPGLPSIAEVEQMLRDHYIAKQKEAEAAKQKEEAKPSSDDPKK